MSEALSPEAESSESQAAPERPWRCRKCLAAITTGDQRIEVDGRHVHLRLNPNAFAFLFGCFKGAPGVTPEGTPTSDATWFAGHQWQYAMCTNCGTHLGWVFTGASSFVALVLERLAPPDA